MKENIFYFFFKFNDERAHYYRWKGQRGKIKIKNISAQMPILWNILYAKLDVLEEIEEYHLLTFTKDAMLLSWNLLGYG